MDGWMREGRLEPGQSGGGGEGGDVSGRKGGVWVAAAPGVKTSFGLQMQLSDVPSSARPASSVCLPRFPTQCHAFSSLPPCVSPATLAFKLVLVHDCANCAQLLVQLLRFSMSFLIFLTE